MDLIARAMQDIEAVTQTSAAGAEQSAAAGEELGAQSQSLRSIVERLNGLVGSDHPA